MAHPVVAIRQPDRTPIFLSIRGPILVGRDCDGCILVDPQVSRCHLKLEPGSVVTAGETHLTLEPGGDATLLLSPAAARGTVVAGSPTSSEPAQPEPGTTRVRSVDVGSSARATSIDLVAAAVRQERPDLSAMQDDAGTVTIVFSDIERSTERAVELGDVRWMEVLDEHNRLVRKQVRAFGGSEIKSQGDGFMLSFPGARRAVLAMVEIQRGLAHLEESDPARSVRVRMGCHTGEVIVDQGGDLFGKHVIVAARIANLANGGEILVSDLVKDLVSSRGDVSFTDSRTVALKGIEGDWDVHSVAWA